VAEAERAFVKEHGVEFQDEIARICRERCGLLDPVSVALRSGLPKDLADALRMEAAGRLEAIAGPFRGDPVQRARVLSDVVRDTRAPIGLRIDALTGFALGAGGIHPSMLGEALSLLDGVAEPILRTKLYSMFLYRSDERRAVSRQALEKATDSVAAASEPRGTTAEIVSSLGTFFSHGDSKDLRSSHEGRVESALVSRLQKEAEREAPDAEIVTKIAVALMEREKIPSTERIGQAESLLRSDRPSVRIAGAALLLPNLEGKGDDPAVSGFTTHARTILLEAIRREKDSGVTATILYGLVRDKDPGTRQLLETLAGERPDLRVQIERYLKD
jgi:hypothetical protein